MAHGGYGWGAPFQVWRGGNSFHPGLYHVWEHRLTTGFLGKLVLQEEWQELRELRSPLLPQHKALFSPLAYASSRSSLPVLHKAISAHAQAAEKTCLFFPLLSRGTRVILQHGKPFSLTALPGLSPEQLSQDGYPSRVQRNSASRVYASSTSLTVSLLQSLSATAPPLGLEDKGQAVRTGGSSKLLT